MGPARASPATTQAARRRHDPDEGDEDMTPARCLAVLALGWGCAPGERPVEPGDTKPGPPGCSDASDLGQVTLDGTRGFGDLQAALDAAQPGSELLLCPGYYLGDFIAEVPVRLAALEDRDTTWLAGTGGEAPVLALPGGSEIVGLTDRKSTRLNSSHVKISYAVLC